MPEPTVAETPPVTERANDARKGASRRRDLLAIGTTLIVLALGAIVASAGPVDTFEEGTGGIDIDVDNEDEQPPPASAPPPVEAEPPPEDADPMWARIVRLVVFALLVAAIISAIVLIARSWLRERDARRTRKAAIADGEFAAPSAHEELAAALDEGLRELDRLPVEDAIVRCWVRLEVAAAEAGVGRRTWETATELTMRVLHAHHVSEPAIRRLLSLYGEARFSQHQLDESARGEARQAVEQLRDELAATRFEAVATTAEPSPP